MVAGRCAVIIQVLALNSTLPHYFTEIMYLVRRIDTNSRQVCAFPRRGTILIPWGIPLIKFRRLTLLLDTEYKLMN